MKISTLGVNHSNNKLLFQPIDLQNFQEKIAKGLKNNKKKIQEDALTTQKTAAGFKGIMQVPAPSPDVPRESGWTFLVNPNDPLCNEIEETILSLAKIRGMTENDKPLYFDNISKTDWPFWIEDEYVPYRIKNQKQAPRYVLIVASPSFVPLKFQAILSTYSYVGRIDFDDQLDNDQRILQLKTYVDKIKRIEEHSPVSHDVIFFATNHGINEQGCYDATHYSHLYLEKPLARDSKRLGFKPNEIVRENATKKKFLNAIKNSSPCLVFTASHGMMNTNQSLKEQKEITGAIVCEGNREKPYDEWLVTAEDIQSDSSFAEGGIFFEYANCSYGTPSSSYLNNWLVDMNEFKIPNITAESDFIASIPKKMLFNPKGPLAFVGHLDVELIPSFTNDEDPIPENDRNNRLEPFSFALESILKGRPVGYALGQMNQRYTNFVISLAEQYQIYQDKSFQDEEIFLNNLWKLFVAGTEAGNYMTLGDPAVRLS